MTDSAFMHPNRNAQSRHTSKTLRKTCIPPSSTNTSQVNGASSTETKQIKQTQYGLLLTASMTRCLKLNIFSPLKQHIYI